MLHTAAATAKRQSGQITDLIARSALLHDTNGRYGEPRDCEPHNWQSLCSHQRNSLFALQTNHSIFSRRLLTAFRGKGLVSAQYSRFRYQTYWHTSILYPRPMVNPPSCTVTPTDNRLEIREYCRTRSRTSALALREPTLLLRIPECRVGCARKPGPFPVGPLLSG